MRCAFYLSIIFLCGLLLGCNGEVPEEARQQYMEISKRKIEETGLTVDSVYCSKYAFKGEQSIHCKVSTTVGLIVNVVCGTDQGNSCSY